jgi:hypothetical protein
MERKCSDKCPVWDSSVKFALETGLIDKVIFIEKGEQVWPPRKASDEKGGE